MVYPVGVRLPLEGFRITTWMEEWCTWEVYSCSMAGAIYHLEGSMVLVTMVGTILPGVCLSLEGFRNTTWLDEWCTWEVYGYTMGGEIYHHEEGWCW